MIGMFALFIAIILSVGMHAAETEEQEGRSMCSTHSLAHQTANSFPLPKMHGLTLSSA